MPLAKHFIEQGIKLMQINEYLRSELVRAGFAGVDLQKTPLGVRITLKTSRPGLVIGKGGKRIQEITDVLSSVYELESPQVEVEEVKNPDVNAQIMAERLAYSLDRGRHYRRAGYYILRKVMDSGLARGVEIIISGKVTSQRARTQIFRAGIMSKSGQPAQDGVDKGVAQCIQKSGTLGVIVKVMRADYVQGDGVKVNHQALKTAQAKISSNLEKTRVEKSQQIEEIEVPITKEARDLIDDVDEDDITEISDISLEPKYENEVVDEVKDNKKNNRKKSKK